jgi:hypothetical protein
MTDITSDTAPVANTLVIYKDTAGNRGVSNGSTPVTCASGINTAAIGLLDPGYVSDPFSSSAGSLWMKTSTDPNRPQFKSNGSLALLSDIPAVSTNSYTTGFVNGGSTATTTISLVKFGTVVTCTMTGATGTAFQNNQATIFTNLPVGYRPPVNTFVPCLVKNGSANLTPGQMWILASGSIDIQPAGTGIFGASSPTGWSQMVFTDTV